MTAKTHKLVDQQAALDAFFESLSHDVEVYAEQEEERRTITEPPEPVNIAPSESSVTPLIKPELVTRPVELVTEAATIFETLPPIAPPEPALETPVAEEAIPPAPVEATPEPAVEKEAAPIFADPPWLGQELQAMLFKVAGLTLAVPLVDLNGVVEWDEEKITSMPGHADFYLGLMSHLNHQVPIVDTARMVLPDSKRRQLAGEDPRQRVTRVVLINNSQYGLACDEVNEVVTLKADAVRWRSERTQRRWLAGTVIEHMCALVDATAFAELLANRTPVDAFRA